MIEMLNPDFLWGILIGIVTGGIIGLIYAQNNLESKSITYFFSHYIMQTITIITFFMIVVFLPRIESIIKIILIFLVAGLYLLFGLRHVPKKCAGSDCNDIRCDVTILRLYGKLSFSFILLGGIIIIIYLIETMLTKLF